VDADHTDTARHYRETVPEQPAQIRWEKRIQALDQYVAGLTDSARSKNRQDVYACCREAPFQSGIVSCDAAVGSGKTTAVMAHLLRAANRRQLRHIFVVLPHTNIIQQSVEVYRRALVLPAETPSARLRVDRHHDLHLCPGRRGATNLGGPVHLSARQLKTIHNTKSRTPKLSRECRAFSIT
jgi:CRISPR-associated endonuclease/helicase Cas3